MIRGEALTRRGIVEAASLTVGPGELVVLLGPNGAGKTTLLRLLLGLERTDLRQIGDAPGRLGGSDVAAVERALGDCDLTSLRDRAVDTLSGGELARVHLARALAAEAPYIVADEPVASLDPRHQLRVLALFERFVENGGGALVVLHDLSLAHRHAGRIIWMAEGRIVDEGPVTPSRIAAVYGVRAQVDANGVVIDGII
jgi:iron complex transport system ATP-binding protein